ncbi:uncharacterized protein LOC134193506 [Corticium candelabrum]|uniref:uncharacterized protein LOC134193506 n=1 Tax=Corticium candelabrum TaxID=121492 RepID=UPI002E25C9A6|nr:uncharacterized protein LOC134193506 [Corticium candelabrum]
MDSKLRSCVSFQKHTGDYHDEMNGEHFLDWFENRLMHNVPERSVIVLDNAPYHNVVLEKTQISSLKANLFAKIRDAAPKRKLFHTNALAQRLGHIFLQSPVAHCELKPIELAWSKVKRYLKEQNQTFKLADLEELVPAAFQSVTPEMWKSHCKHVEK